MSAKKKYADTMFAEISNIIETTGKDDPEYTNKTKALDILNVLEGLLAYTIYSTCYTTDEIRDSAEETYFNIKKQALAILRKHPPKE